MSNIENIKKLLDELELPQQVIPRIGVAITEHNRYDVFKKSYVEIKKHLPPGAFLVVVDDASSTPVKEATFRFNKNVGIAAAKNKCIELLMNADCEHLFLFDSDTYPLCSDWWKPYVECSEPHLNYIFKDFATGKKLNDCDEIYQNDEIIAYNHVRGCMLYYHRSVIEKVGGMDTIFGKWGCEHGNLSDRIHVAGLTSFRYMDIVNSSGLFYSADEHQAVSSTVEKKERDKLLPINLNLYDERKFKSYYFPYVEKKNVLICCYFSGVHDAQRNLEWKTDSAVLDPLIKSLKNTKLIVLHNCFDLPNTDNVEFVRVSSVVSPYIQRWVSVRKWLMDNRKSYENVFCIDSTDVEVLREPAWDRLKDAIWMGDENDLVGCNWLVKNHRNPILQDFFKNNSQEILLNCGVIGGSLDNIIELLRQVIDFYGYNHLDYGMTEMGIFNYICYTNWRDKMKTGREITTLFKGFETENKTSWFKHK
ncbi:glycosyltransferase family 2 protein [Flavobacterium sp. 3HN19-14]|uniref:glycosyltransferase family 2 protein n=1 Tax=Flavobacterium sp. 3HN19-14 TaxID=3448133 RepID=UPI003EE22A32